MIFRASLLTTLALVSQMTQARPDYSLILIGGGVKSCSSMALQGCVPDTKAPAGSLTEQQYQFPAGIDRKLATLAFPAVQQAQANALLRLLAARHGAKVLSERDLKSAIRSAELEVDGQWTTGRDIWQQFSEGQKDAIYDLLQLATIKEGRHVPEVAMPLQLNNNHSLGIYQEIVNQAKKAGNKAKPRIVIFTASSRDPFAAVSYYKSLFNTLGAETSWLPINLAFQKAQVDGASLCKNFASILQQAQGTNRREEMYPDLFEYQQNFCREGHIFATKALRDADAVFFNGGDQSLTYQAFKNADGSDTPELAVIREKFNAGTLVIAGTSAGTAVQTGAPHVMITGGDSVTAFEKPLQLTTGPCGLNCTNELGASPLTGQGSGGLGFFPYGVLDTHFSERGRQGRLWQLLSQTKGQLGVGIDENTALLVKPLSNGASMRVLGEGGVFFTQPGPLPTIWRTHYLTQDDQVTVAGSGKETQLQFQLAPWKYTGSNRKQMLMRTNDVFTGSRYRSLASLMCQNHNDVATGRFDVNGKAWQLTMNRNSQTNSRNGSYQVQGQVFAACSYHDLLVSYQELHE